MLGQVDDAGWLVEAYSLPPQAGGVEAPILASALACQEADLDKHGVLTCRGDLEDECVRGLGVTRHTRR